MHNVIPEDIRPAFPEPVRGDGVRTKLLEILGLDRVPGPADVDFALEATRDEPDGVRWTRIAYRNSLGEQVPGIIMMPVDAPAGLLPGVVCVPGTGGSAEEVADQRFEPTPPDGRVRGFGREMARRGYAAMAISIKGCHGRPQMPGRWEQEAKYLEAYGRPQMGLIAEETLRAARILASQEGVDSDRIGLTGMSLGGLATWYPMACDPWIKAGAPICGGLGSMARNIHEGLPDRSSSAIFVPHMLRYFDHPQIVASCIAPRPFMTVAPTMDEDMPISGVEQLVREVAPVYRSADCPDRFKVYQPQGTHQFLIQYFEWMVEWFDRWL